MALPSKRRQISSRQDSRDLDGTLGFMQVLWSLDNALQSASKLMAKRYGITGPQRLALRITGQYPGITTGHLADLLRYHPSTLTGVLRRLSERGFLRQTRDPADRRRVLLELTPTGKAINELRSGTAETAVRAALAKIPDRKARELRAGLEIFIDQLQHMAATLPNAPTARQAKKPTRR